jgi:fused signal recognition particle receptor
MHDVQFYVLLMVIVVSGAGGFAFWANRRGRSDVEALQAEKAQRAKRDGALSSAPPAPSAQAEAHAPTQAPQDLWTQALGGTRASLFGRLQNLFGGRQILQGEELERLEEVLYTADLGPRTVEALLGKVTDEIRREGGGGFEAVRSALAKEMREILSRAQGDMPAEDVRRLNVWSASPSVLMVVGVNGAGKTTTIGKLSAKLAADGRRVLVAAGDTFRAAAGEQLKAWTERARVEIFDPAGVEDPSAVAYQAVEYGKAKGFDVVIIDTAGRLHTQKNLMEELKKMKRVVQKLIADSPHETLLVLDANAGQNALMQAREFHAALQCTGVVLTKLDGSAKGGVAIGLAHEIGVPIKLVGVGEKIGDLRSFETEPFIESII